MLRAEGLSKSFGSLRAARDVSLEVATGSRHAVIGPNGAGKTTLFNLLTGEIKPDAGRVFVGDQDVTRKPPDARARAGMARSFQRNNLFPDLTVRDNLAIAHAVRLGIGLVFWRSFRGYHTVHGEAERIAERILIGDSLETPVRQLPYGIQRIVEVGLALASKPKILLLDEPTSGMSPEETAAMQALIKNLPEDLTVVVIEHDMDVVFDLADRITVLDYGSVLAEGTAAEIRASEVVRQRYLGEAVE